MVTGRQRGQRLVSDEGLVFELLVPVIPEEVPEHDLVTIAPSAGSQQDVGGDAPHWKGSIASIRILLESSYPPLNEKTIS